MIQTSRLSLIVFLVLLIVTLLFTGEMIGPFLPYIVMGGILAILTRPLYIKLQEKHFRKRLAALSIVFLIFILIVGPLTFFVSRAVQQGISLGQTIAKSDALSTEGLANKAREWHLPSFLVGAPEDLEVQVRTSAESIGKLLSGILLAQISNIPQLLLHTVIALITCFVFLTDGRRFANWITEKIPLDDDIKIKLTTSFKNTSVSVIWATLAAAFAQSLVILTAFLVTGAPAAFLAAGLAFIFAWIPLIGTSPVWVVGALYLLSEHSPGKMIAMILLGLSAGIVDNIVRPLVLRGRSDMHPLVSLIAIFGGIRMFGILGIFFGPIIAALVIAMLHVWPAVGRRLGFTFGSEAKA